VLSSSAHEHGEKAEPSIKRQPSPQGRGEQVEGQSDVEEIDNAQGDREDGEEGHEQEKGHAQDRGQEDHGQEFAQEGADEARLVDVLGPQAHN
jgi:hypothetical protein